MASPEWQYCDCDIEELEELCGCGKDHRWSNSQKPIHWREQHWIWECAFNVLVEENDDMRRRLVKFAVDKIFQRRRNILQDFTQEDEE
ncbi:MAG: hypothetical protein HY819_08715 [Acidobacteria bacterium]|nr:hypothetical protein [Acidobacteriota bacterium]